MCETAYIRKFTVNEDNQSLKNQMVLVCATDLIPAICSERTIEFLQSSVNRQNRKSPTNITFLKLLNQRIYQNLNGRYVENKKRIRVSESYHDINM